MTDPDRDDPYARKRARAKRRRMREDQARFDPRPPEDGDWTVPEGSAVSRVAGPSALGEVLAALIRRSGWRDRLEGVAVHDRWPEIAGPELAARCEPVRLAGATLLVRAESQAWATELRYMLPMLTARANDVLGAGTVRRINLTVGPLRARDEPGRG